MKIISTKHTNQLIIRKTEEWIEQSTQKLEKEQKGGIINELENRNEIDIIILGLG